MTRGRPPSDLSGRGGRCGVQILAGAVLLAEFFAAFAQQFLQRVHAGGDAERHRLWRWPVPLLAPRLGNLGNLVALGRRLADERLARIAVVVAQRLGQFRIEIDRAFTDIAGLRPLA